MFTSVKPNVRHIVPRELKGRSLLKVVYIVLEAQYQSSLSGAVRSINEKNPNLAIEISGYLIEELRDPKNYENFKREVSEANIFIASLIFIEDLAEKVVEAVTPHRDKLDAAVVFPSMPQVMRLNKMGTFSMAQLIRPEQKRHSSIYAEAEGKIWFFFPRRNVEVTTNSAESIEVYAS